MTSMCPRKATALPCSLGRRRRFPSTMYSAEKDSNNYIVELQVLQGEKMNIKTDYTCLIQKENNKYYINRIINNILLEDRNPENFITNDNLYNDYIKNFVDSIQKQEFIK